MRARDVAVLLLAQWSCGVQDPISVQISGQLAESVEGAQRRFVFGSDSPPQIAVADGNASLSVRFARHLDFEATVHTSTTPVALAVDGEWRGDDTLIVRSASGESRFLLRWAPTNQPLFELTRLAASPIHNEAFWGIEELAFSAYQRGERAQAASLWASYTDPRLAEMALSRAATRLRLSVFLDNLSGRAQHELDARVEHAQNYARQLSDHTGLSRGLMMQSQLRRTTNEFLQALKSSREARKQAELANAASAIRRSQQMEAIILSELGRLLEALAVLEDCRPPITASRRERGTHITNMAWVHALLMLNGELTPDLSTVIAEYEMALELLGPELAPEYNNVRARIAFVKHHQGAPDVAADIEALLAISQEDLGEARDFVRILAIEHALAQNDDAGAARQARALIDELRIEYDGFLNVWLATAEGLLAEALFRLGDMSAARAQFEVAEQTIAAISRSFAVPRTRAQFHHARRRVAVSHAELLLRQGDFKEALRLLNQSRSRLMSELERHVRVEQNSDVWRRYAEARSRFEGLKRAGCAQWVRAQSKTRCRAEIEAAAQEAEERLQAFHRKAKTPKIDGSFDLPSILKRLGDSAAFFVSGKEDSSWVFVLYRGRLKFYRNPDVDSLLNHVSDATHLFVVPSDLEDGLDVLAAAQAKGLSLSLLPHLGLLLQTKATRSGPSVVVGDPDGSLPHARREASDIGRSLSATTLFGAQASREAVVSALEGASIFHFSGHTQPRLGGGGVGLQLTHGQQLGVEDLLRVGPRPRLVVLAACSSGATQFGAQDTLPSAFLQTGADAVVATVRPISDGASADFLAAFYAAGGADEPVDAFRAAVAKRRAAGGKAWASFRLWGGVRHVLD